MTISRSKIPTSTTQSLLRFAMDNLGRTGNNKELRGRVYTALAEVEARVFEECPRILVQTLPSQTVFGNRYTGPKPPLGRVREL